jgi:hypothetical protein
MTVPGMHTAMSLCDMFAFVTVTVVQPEQGPEVTLTVTPVQSPPPKACAPQKLTPGCSVHVCVGVVPLTETNPAVMRQH